MTQQGINNASMLKVGTILRGTYRIDSYLSSGGFGNTYIATNIEFDERVAIKEFFMKGVTQRDDNQTTVSVSNSENTNSFQEQKEKFKKEARRLRKLQNEHIVKVYDMFDENGTAYYVMDYVDGENLAERLKRTGRPMTESEVRLILPQILDALKAVHNEGFCHLDIKPSNIMLDKGGKVKLIDFGASKQLGANGTLTTNAPTAFAQTPGYAPREQMEQNLDKIGPWTDIYALGATLYNLLTNKRPPMPTDIDDDMSEDKHLALPFPESVGGLRYLVLQMMKTKCTHPNYDYTPKHCAEKSSAASNDDNPTSTERNNDTKSVGKQIIDYVKQPFGRVSLTFMALSISLCVAIILIPALFYIFGEYSYVQDELALGDFVLSDFSSWIQIAYYSFFVISIVYLIPLIIGLGHIRPLLANMLALTCILSIGKFVENLLIEENSLLNWVLFYGEHLLFIILGFIIISTYNGRIKKLGFVLIVYSIICSLLNLLFYQIGIRFESEIQYGCYELLVWGIDLLQVWGIWWFLRGKEVIDESH